MTCSQYPQLKEQIVIIVSTMNKPNKLLSALKEHYKDQINSPRRNDEIQTIGQLLLVLEIRDVLSENHVKPLKEIGQRIGTCGDLLRKIDEFEKLHVPTEQHNHYNSHNTNERKFNNKQKKCNTLNTPYTNVCQKKKEDIYGTVVQQLGIYWRDLARYLKFPESKIDEIDRQCETLKSKALRLMEIYDQEADPQKWLFVLCKSLELARRKDLAKAIQEILMMN